MFDYLIVGAGFAGSVLAERLARGSGKQVLLVDRRPHIGGNAFDHYDDAGILVHKYGPHIFHTNSREVFEYLSRLHPLAPLRAPGAGERRRPAGADPDQPGHHQPALRAEPHQHADGGLPRLRGRAPRDEVRTSEDVVVGRVGRELYEKFFRGYTRKQWGLDPSQLDAMVTARVPVRTNRDDRYFADTYQAMPLRGYTRLFENMLDHDNIKILLNTDYREVVADIPHGKLIYTGPVDEFFDFRYGKLPYRSLRFEHETRNQEWVQPVAVINYPNEHLYTRVTEFKHLTGQEHPKSSLVYEYPTAEGDPYYPVPRPENNELYKRYQALAEERSDVHFVGRLATYKYYNMDQVVAQALSVYARIVGQKRAEATRAEAPAAAHRADRRARSGGRPRGPPAGRLTAAWWQELVAKGSPARSPH